MEKEIKNKSEFPEAVTPEELAALNIDPERFEYSCMNCEASQDSPGLCENCGSWVQRIYI